MTNLINSEEEIEEKEELNELTEIIIKFSEES